MAGLAPERLRREVVTLLADATGAPASLEALRLVIGFPMHLEAEGLRLYRGALTLDYVAVRLSPLSLLVGKPRLSALEADGVALTLTRVAPGRWEPDLTPDKPPPPRPTEEPLLGALEIFERTARAVLERPTVADSVSVRRASIRYLEAADGRELALVQDLRGELVHRPLRDDAEASASASVRLAGGEPAAVEAQGTRSREGVLDLSVAVTALDLEDIETRPRHGLRGSLSGILDYQSESRGEGDLAFDFVVEDLVVRGSRGAAARSFETPRFASRVRASLSAGQLDVTEASVSAGRLGVQLAATLERPIDRDSHLGLTLILEEIDVERARTIVGWLPDDARHTAERALERVRGGILTRVEARGGADWAEWQRLLDGHTRSMPWGMRLAVDVGDLSVELGADGGALFELAGRLVWDADRIELKVPRAQLDGTPLPALEAEIHGVSHLFASDPSRRELVSGAPPLPGLAPLWETLWGDSGRQEYGESTAVVSLEVDYMHHPALLWPLTDVRARVEPGDGHTRVEIEQAEWAGIPLEGNLRAHSEEDRLELVLVVRKPLELARPAQPARLLETPDEAGRIWAMGRFQVGPIDQARWKQRAAHGSFQAVGDEVDVTGVTIALTPQGELTGAGWLDLGESDRALFEVEASLDGGDVETWMEILTRGGGVRGGTLSAEASLSGALAPDLPLLSRLAGDVTLKAQGGAIRASVPALVALALATDTLNAFGGHDEVRYDRVETTLTFDAGRMSTKSLDIDGPDLRLFASGELDVLRDPHPVDAQFALFLFRHVDRALVNIPIVNALLLGRNDNLVAAHFSLKGPWRDPVARPLPLRTITESPAGAVLTGIPDVMVRGLKALGGILTGSGDGSGDESGDGSAAPRQEAGANPRRGG